MQIGKPVLGGTFVNDTLSLSIRNDIKEVANVFSPVNEILSNKGLTTRIQYAVNLVLEELLINIIKYAYKDNKAHTIDAQIEIHEEKIAITLQDDGIAFNPLSLPPPDRSKPVMDRLGHQPGSEHEKGNGISSGRRQKYINSLGSNLIEPHIQKAGLGYGVREYVSMMP